MLTWHQSMYCSISWVILPSLIKILGTPSLVASIPDPKGAICHFPTEHRGLSAVSHPWHFILGCKPTQCALQVTPVVANRSTSSVLRPPDQSSPPPLPGQDPVQTQNVHRSLQPDFLLSFLPTVVVRTQISTAIIKIFVTFWESFWLVFKLFQSSDYLSFRAVAVFPDLSSYFGECTKQWKQYKSTPPV